MSIDERIPRERRMRGHEHDRVRSECVASARAASAIAVAESPGDVCARASDLGHHDGRMRSDDAEHGRVHCAHLPGHA